MHKRKTKPRPDWLKISLRTDENYTFVHKLLEGHSLNTVCQEARCPNIYECFSHKTATFMILGNTCTRRCRFCSVRGGRPEQPDPEEPKKVAEAAASLGLRFVVVTSVTRDDLPDGGSRHFAATIRAIKKQRFRCGVEVLIPDFRGNSEQLDVVLQAHPDVLAHNVETVHQLYRRVRPQADYQRSLKLLGDASRHRRKHAANLKVKSGIMVGLGETMEQIVDTMRDILNTGCDIMTIGQYLCPVKEALPVDRYYTPNEFDELRDMGLEMGFRHVESGPLVRSSYHAEAHFKSVEKKISS